MDYVITFILARAMPAAKNVFHRGESGQDLIEYALLGGLIAAAIIAVGVLAFSGALTSMATGIGNCIDFDKSSACNPF